MVSADILGCGQQRATTLLKLVEEAVVVELVEVPCLEPLAKFGVDSGHSLVRLPARCGEGEPKLVAVLLDLQLDGLL